MSNPSCMRRSMSTRRPVTHLGFLARASAAIRSSCQRANSLTVGMGFFVSATFEILDDASQLVFGDVLVFHCPQHGWNQVVLPHNTCDIRRYLIAAFGGQVVKDFKVFHSLPQAERLGDSAQRVHWRGRQHVSLKVAVV